MSTNGTNGTNGKKPSSITRQSLTEELMAEVPGLSSKEASRLVDSIILCIRETLSKGEEVKISGFGKFVLQDKKARKGRNPQTGEELIISARRVLKFRPSEVLKDELNQNLFAFQGNDK